jgi:hypothetical protein
MDGNHIKLLTKDVINVRKMYVKCLLALSDYKELEISRDILLTPPPPPYKIYENQSTWIKDCPRRRTDLKLKNAFHIPAGTFNKIGWYTAQWLCSGLSNDVHSVS